MLIHCFLPVIRYAVTVPSSSGHRHGDGLQRAEVAARLRLGRAVGHQQALGGDASQPASLLLRRAADHDRVAAEERRQHRGGDAEVDGGHPLAGPVDVEGRAAHAAVLLGDEQQLDAEVVAAHPLDQLGGELVALVEVDEQLLGQLVRGELADRVERHLQRVSVKASHVSVLLRVGDVAVQRRGVMYFECPPGESRGIGTIGPDVGDLRRRRQMVVDNRDDSVDHVRKDRGDDR